MAMAREPMGTPRTGPWTAPPSGCPADAVSWQRVTFSDTTWGSMMALPRLRGGAQEQGEAKAAPEEAQRRDARPRSAPGRARRACPRGDAGGEAAAAAGAARVGYEAARQCGLTGPGPAGG
ncbi:unnamed protein product, partial [Prorocentrum cordatum]